MARSITAAAFGRSDRTILLAAILLAAIAAVLVFVAASSGSDNTTKTVAPVAGGVEVVTAINDIPANTTVTADMVKVTSISASAVLAQAYTATDGLVGLTTRYPLLAGEQITPNKLGTDVKDDKSLALVVPPSKRAIAIPVGDENIVGGLILPGDLVDVIAVFDANDTGTIKAVTLVQNVEVLAVGTSAETAIARPLGTTAPTDGSVGSYGETPDDAKAQPDAATLTLAVTPDQAQQLALAAKTATLWTSLRSRGDNTDVKLGESTLEPYQSAAEPAVTQ